MSTQKRSFKVDTKPSKAVVVSSLTRDATIEACIFDLIDNSIDAAQAAAKERGDSDSDNPFLSDYTGYEIDLKISGSRLSINDNCGGITVIALRQMVLRFGVPSPREASIGAFGVGLNRAIFRLGTSVALTTDTGSERANLTFSTDSYLKSEDWDLPAVELTTTGIAGTSIVISDPPEDIARQLADESWLSTFREETERRYARFLSKKLTIKINERSLTPKEVKIRDGGAFDKIYKVYKTTSGVSVHIEYGQHLRHRFTKEDGYSIQNNKELSGEFGWTVLCNDRAVLISDRTDKTGWDSQWHTEFNGFVGIVNFTGPSNLLPWSTTKVDVDLNNSSYRAALEDMRRFVAAWRTFSEKRKKEGVTREVPPTDPSSSEQNNAQDKKGARKPQQENSTSKDKAKPKAERAETEPTKKGDYHELRTVIPNDIDEAKCYDKHLILVHEAKNLDLLQYTFTGIALLRILIETSGILFLHRNGRIADAQQFSVNKRKASGMTIQPKDEKKVVPSLDEMFQFFDANPDIFGAKERQIKHTVKVTSGNLGKINSALHNPFQAMNKATALQIRDEALPLVRLLIET